MHRAVDRICKFYKSTIIGLYLGDDLTLILNDPESVRKALNHRDFDGRPDILLGRLRHPNMELHGEKRKLGCDGQLMITVRSIQMFYFE